MIRYQYHISINCVALLFRNHSLQMILQAINDIRKKYELEKVEIISAEKVKVYYLCSQKFFMLDIWYLNMFATFILPFLISGRKAHKGNGEQM